MRKFILLVMTLAFLTGCAQAAASPTSLPPTVTSPAPAQPPTPTQSPAPTPSPTNLPGTNSDQAALLAPLVAAAAAQLGLPADQITLVSVEPREWRDGCLGLGGRDEICTQAITPGFLVTFNSPSGKIYFHTDQKVAYFRMAPFQPASVPASDLLTWRRSGGFAGICQVLHVAVDGTFVLTKCDGTVINQGSLPASDWNYIQKQARLCQSYEWNLSPPAGSADMFLDSFALTGQGSQIPSSKQQEQFNTWLGELSGRLAQLPASNSQSDVSNQGQGMVNLTVLVGPTCPGPVRLDDPSCADKPLSAQVNILDQQGSLVKSVQTDAFGAAVVNLPPGVYTFSPQASGIYPRGQPQVITLAAGSLIQVTMVYDSGIR